MIKLKNILLEKKELDSKSIKSIAIMTDRNFHTEARARLSKMMGWKKGIKFYKAMAELNDVFGGFPGPASKLNEMMEQQLYKQMYRKWSNYEEIYNVL